MFNIPALDKLIHELSLLPGIGPKTAQRLVHHILRERQYSENLREALSAVEDSIKLCSSCFSYTDDSRGICHYCTTPKRRDDVICVVETPESVMQIEASGSYNGRFHVLHGAISPLHGLTPDKLKIKELSLRIDLLLEKAPQSKVEVILALDADLEGDTTMLYLAKLFAETPQVTVSRLAQGVPIGSHLDFVDHRTLGRALENRVRL
ncbi:MAG: recombination protein RecR [Bdellovibrionaceae bacterium]|nr:recombination protein RecR [Pseudobdellovibrionaceae bacterium]